MRLFRPLAVLAVVAGAGCAGLPPDPPKAPVAADVRRTPFTITEGYEVVRLESRSWLGCTAVRPPGAASGADWAEASHIGLVRLASGAELLAMGGTRNGPSLGDRREVPVTVDVAGSSDAGSGVLDNQYFNAFTSASQMPALLRGSTATLRFAGGFTVGRSYRPGVIRELSRCYAETLADAGIGPGGAAARVPVARGSGGAKPSTGGSLTPDVAGVSIE